MLSVSFDRSHRILRFDFAGLFTIEDLEAIDVRLLDFLSQLRARDRTHVRVLYDMTNVTALAVPSSRFAARAQLAAVGGVERIVVKPRDATPEFGHSYREQEGRLPHRQPTVVTTLDDAYALLGLGKPRFEPVPPAE